MLLTLGVSVLLASTAVFAAGPAAKIELVPGGEAGAVFVLRCDTAPVIRAVGQSWGESFRWAETDVRTKARLEDGSRPFTWTVADLGISSVGQIRCPQANIAAWNWNLKMSKAIARNDPRPHAKGGITFFLDIGSAARRGFGAIPVLKADKTGFTWEVTPGQSVDVTFARPLAELYFEVNQPNQIRASLYAAPVEPGEFGQTMTVTMPDGASVGQTIDERYAWDSAKGFTDAFDVDEWPVDLSYLNDKPAGEHGAVRAKGDHLEFADGTAVRFWGVSLQGASIDPQKDGKFDKARIDKQARRLARLGFNIVRFTHMDSWWCQPNLLGGTGPTSDKIDDAYLDAMHYTIAALKKQGIYVQLDMITYRPFYPADNIPGFEDLRKQFPKEHDGALSEGTMYLNPRLRELWRQTTRELLTRVNPYTGLAPKDDPAIASIVTLNENDLTFHFGNALLADKGVPYHNKLFLAKVSEFAKATDLNEQELGVTWLDGPGKLLLNDIQYRWQADAVAFIRDLGFKGPVIAGHIWGMPISSLPALQAGDVTDAHMYSGPESLSTDPRAVANFMHSMAYTRVADRPTWISEVNMEDTFRQYDTFTVLPYVAALAAFQTWDAPTLYGYSQDGFGGWNIQMWSSYSHPSVLALAPAAALMYRDGHVQPAKKTIYVPLDREQVFYKGLSAENVATLRTAMERHGVCVGLPNVKELTWLEPTTAPPGAEVVTDLDRDFIPPGNVVEADTGEFRRDWTKGVFVVDAPRTQLVMGQCAGQWQTADIAWSIASPIAGLSVSALDGRPIRESARLVVCTMGRAAIQKNTVITEPVQARLELQSSLNGLRLVPLKPDGSAMPAVKLSASSGRWTVDLPGNARTHWFLIEADEPR
jgi:hypothetical protein